MSLVQIILEGRKEDFARKFSNKFSEEQLRNIIDRSDVLPGQHKYLNFLGKVVNPKNFNADLNIAVKLLEKFSTVGQNLNLKDINQYDKISTLKKALDDYDNRIRREIKTVDDADVIYEDNEMIVVSPKTHKSSCYFGAGTKWCTTASDSGHYDRYNQDGKLFYFISKTKPTSDPTTLLTAAKVNVGTSGQLLAKQFTPSGVGYKANEYIEVLYSTREGRENIKYICEKYGTDKKQITKLKLKI